MSRDLKAQIPRTPDENNTGAIGRNAAQMWFDGKVRSNLRVCHCKPDRNQKAGRRRLPRAQSDIVARTDFRTRWYLRRSTTTTGSSTSEALRNAAEYSRCSISACIFTQSCTSNADLGSTSVSSACGRSSGRHTSSKSSSYRLATYSSNGARMLRTQSRRGAKRSDRDLCRTVRYEPAAPPRSADAPVIASAQAPSLMLRILARDLQWPATRSPNSLPTYPKGTKQ